MIKFIIILIFLLSFQFSGFSQIDRSEVFSSFSIENNKDLSSRIVKKQSIDSFWCFMYSIDYKGDSMSFWIGLKDSIYYTFKNNNLKKPKKLINFGSEFKGEIASFFYTSKGKYRVYITEVDFNQFQFKESVDVYFDFSKRFMKHIPVSFSVLSLYQGLILDTEPLNMWRKE